MKIYLSGPITGVPDYKEKFKAAQERAEAFGHEVLNPAELPGGMTPHMYMMHGFSAVGHCDAVVLLPNPDCQIGQKITYSKGRNLPQVIDEWNQMQEGGKDG